MGKKEERGHSADAGKGGSPPSSTPSEEARGGARESEGEPAAGRVPKSGKEDVGGGTSGGPLH